MFSNLKFSASQFLQAYSFVISIINIIKRQMYCYLSVVGDWTVCTHLSMQSSYFSVALKPMMVYVTVAA